MTINNATNKPYYTQRNNAVNPSRSCNVTAMVSALSAAGWPVDRLRDPMYTQPEDVLMHYLLTDGTVQTKWKLTDPRGLYPPNEWHEVLCFGTNRLLRDQKLLGASADDAVCFREDRTLRNILAGIDSGGAAVMSGQFTDHGRQINHVVAVTGYVKNFIGCVTDIIIQDSWGDYRTEYRDINGRDIVMPLSDAEKILRPADRNAKMAHIVRPCTGGGK